MEWNKYRGLTDGLTVRDASDVKWFPSLRAYSEGLSSSADISFTYSSFITRPTLTMLEPTLYYSSPYYMVQGNPKLRPSVDHSLGLTLNLWQKLDITLSYVYSADAVIQTYRRQGGDKNIIIESYHNNINRTQKLGLDISIYKTWGFFTLRGSADLFLPFTRYEYLGEMKKYSRLNYFINIYNDFKIADNTYLTLNGFYSGKQLDILRETEPMYNLFLSFSQYFLEKSLMISLSVSNILRSNFARSRTRIGNTDIYSRYDNDDRGFWLTVSYSFNKFKGMKDRSGNREQLERVSRER